MNCQSCNKQVVQLLEYDNGKAYTINRWECPEGHVTVHIADDKIYRYKVYFERNFIMYRLEGEQAVGTKLFSKDTRFFKRGGFKEMLTVPQYLSLLIKDDVIQVELLVEKLRKLVIFS